MVEFLEKHPNLASGRAKDGKLLWHVAAKKLNAIEGGVRRPSRLWAKSWFDKKSTLKKLLTKQNLQHKRGLPITHVKWTPLDLRIIKLLQKAGELKNEDLEHIENAVKNVIMERTDIKGNDEESLPSHASSPTLSEDDHDNSNDSRKFEDTEYLGTSDDRLNGVDVKLPKLISLHNRNNNTDPLQAEWSRVASLEEKRLKIEQNSARARQETSDALQRCAMAMETLAGAVNYQGAVISDALRAQGAAIAEALKEQGRMVAEALAKR